MAFFGAAVAGLTFWNFVQIRATAKTSHARWVGRLEPMVMAEWHKYLRWAESLSGRVDAPSVAARAPFKVVAQYLADTGAHRSGRWTSADAPKALRLADPRLVEMQLQALNARRTLPGPLLFINQVPYVTVVRPLSRVRALALVIEAPEIRRILDDETRLWGRRISILTDQGVSLIKGQHDSRDVPRLFFITTTHPLPSLGWEVTITEPLVNVFLPLAAFLGSFILLLVLAGVPWRARDEMRSRKIISDLQFFGAKVDRYIRGKEAVPPDPPVPYGRELGIIVQALKWMMPQWKKAEAFPEELGVEKMLLSLLVESLPEGIIFFNAQGHVQLSNEAGRVFLSHEAEKGKEFKMVAGKKIPQGFLLPFVEPVFQGEQRTMGKEVEVKWGDGKHLYRIWVEAVEAVEGRVEGYMVVVRDITFRKQWDYVQEQVLSGITHDLRGPLSAVMGYLDLIKRQLGAANVPPKTQEYVKLAKDGAIRLNQMVSDMLDVVRFEQGKIDLAPEAIPIGKIFERLKNTFTVTAEQKGVRLALKSECPASAVTWGDPKLFERVFDNLVTNAIKFTPAGGTITVTAKADNGRKVFKVEDTGRGIPKEAQSRIFDKFQQVRPGDRSAGYGLGLAVVKFILEAHKGEIRVESEVGQGSQFTFWVPDAAAGQAARPSGPANASPSASPGGSSHS